ncbi:MAG: PD-(D/E)XK nuclease family transposase [Turicibacter sp.]|nr:PD-(D/E)XK nuclease family transposase [Turicibacter sp.]
MTYFYADVVSPLADPVITAIFANVEVSGKAADSLIRNTLATDGETIGKILKVTPQDTNSAPLVRGCRIDVDAEYTKKVEALIEVQVNPDPTILQRNLFGASYKFVNTSRKGDSHRELAENMPKVISINLLAYKIRPDSELVQPVKILYTKPPQEVAISNFMVYNIQLPAVLDMPPNFEDGLYCWCYTLYTAHAQGKTIEEVLKMQPELKTFARADEGYQQFCERFDYFSASPTERKKYSDWQQSMMQYAGEMQGARDEGRLEGRILTATKMLSKGVAVEDIILYTDLSFDTILSLKNNPNGA